MIARPGLVPEPVRDAMEAVLATSIIGAVALAGGMVNAAAKVDTVDGPVFMKWNYQPLPGLFTTEAKGLRTLAQTRTLRVPQVLALDDATTDDATTPAWLVLEYIETPPPADPASFATRFATELAALHHPTSSFGFGLDYDNYLGSLPQKNTPYGSWPEFYRACRLLPQLAIARQRGLLPTDRERLVMRVVDQLEVLLDDMEPRSALIHGDLWSGNFLAAGAEPVIIDPAISYSDREMELAFIELFGGFPSGFVAAYHDAYPIDPGYPRRRALHQLYPLLVHLNHFGEEYGPGVERVCREYTD